MAPHPPYTKTDKEISPRGKERMCMLILYTFFYFPLFVPSVSKADLVNSNFIVLDDMEYYIQTNQSVYDLGENVELLYRVTNLGTEETTFYFPQDPEWNFWAYKNQENVWRAVNGWWTRSTSLTLSPSESEEYSYIWDMVDSDGYLVESRGYDIVGGLFSTSGGYEYTEVEVPITIVPEPSSLALLIIGVSVVGHFRRKK
ncbi:MAG: PEP-CTERM sorting domain-containing protein [Planctomycetota bacterium]